jgi:sugar lactone lactonase YvrE
MFATRWRFVLIALIAMAARLSAQSILTVAGGGTDDGRPATATGLDPSGVALDASGNLYIADGTNARIRKVAAGNGIISTVAGTGSAGFSGDGGPATAAGLSSAARVALDASGNLYIADSFNNRIRKVAAGSGIISTVAGNGSAAFSGDGGPATAAGLNFPYGVALDASGNLYIADHQRIRQVAAGSGIISTVAGNGSAGFSGDGGPATAAGLQPYGVALDASGNLYIADVSSSRIRKVTAGSGIISTVAGNGSAEFSGDGGLATAAGLSSPVDVALDASGNLYIAVPSNNRIRKVAAGSGIISTVAGNGSAEFSGDGGSATAAGLYFPVGVALDASGSLYIADSYNNRIRKVAAGSGIISTVAGNGTAGFLGDGGPATTAGLASPRGVALDPSGNLYITDSGNRRIREVAAGSGIISTVAGNGTGEFSGDGGPATAAGLFSVTSPALDASGNLYIADTYNYRIRKVVAESGIISTVAGNGSAGFSGDGGPATAAGLARPFGLALDASGNLYFADTDNYRIRKVTAGSGIISTVAGNGSTGFSGDGGPATAARLSPVGVALDASGNLYFTGNNRIRKVTAGSGIISTVAGNSSTGFSGDGGPATAAGLNFPYGVALDASGNLYIADSLSNRVRAVLACITVAAPTLTFPATGATGIATAPTLIWNKVDGAFRYDVYLSTTNPPSLIASDLTSTTFAPSNLSADVTYFWRVVAKGDPFCTPQSTATSETRSFTTLTACTAPGAFDLSEPANGASGVGATTQLSWQGATGAGSYDLYFGTSNPPPLLVGGIITTSRSVSGLGASTTYYWYVVVHATCDLTKTTASPTRSFQTAGACAAAGAFSLSSPSNGAAGVSTTTTLDWSSSSNASSYDVYLGTSSPPPLYLLDVPAPRIGVSGLASLQTYSWRVVAKVACDPSKNLSSATSTFTTAGACTAPGASSIVFVPPGNVGVGQTYTVAWQELPDLGTDGYYIVERSTSSSFATILDSQQSFSTSASFISSTAGTYYHRVRAVPGCDPSLPGPVSAVKSVNVVTGTANVIFTVQPQAVITAVGDKLEDQKARFTLENLGTSSLQVILGKAEINSVPFFAWRDVLGGDPVFVTLDPRTPRSFDIQFSGPPNDRSGAYQGIVFVAATGQGLAITPYAFVNLKVGGGTTSRPVFLSNGAPTEYAFFPGFAGDDTNRPPITTMSIRNDGTAPMELGAEIGPEVWLVPEKDWNVTPIPAGASRPVRLTTQRSRAPNGSALPRYTYFTVRSKNGETARLLVQDNDAVRTGVGRSSLLDPGSRSYIVPGVTSRAAGGATVMSRVRLTNVGSERLQTDLFFTPAGTDGFDAALVKRATVVVPPNDVVTLTDPLVQVFGLAPPADGQIEVRAAPERIGFLIVSATVITPVATGGAQTYQLATLRLGEGARIGNAHSMVGLSTSSSVRASLTLAETSGTEATRVHATVYDDQGNRRGETSQSVTRYGQKSIDVGAMVGGATLEGGRVELTVESGGGSVAGVLTVLDGSKNSGLTIVSQPGAGTSSASALVRMLSRVGQSSVKATAIVPVVVNGVLPGGGGTAYRTSMGFAVSGSKATAVVTYRPSDPTALAVEKTVPLTPGLVLHFNNVLEQLFGVASGSSAQGSVFIGGAAGAQIYAQLFSSSGVGGSSSTTGSLPIFATVSEVMTSIASRRPLYLDGLEQSIEATRGSRWSVLLNETAGSNGTVTVRLYEAGNRSLPIAEKALTIRGYEQIRLDTVFAALGLDSAERRKDRTNVLCMVTADGGGAIISAVGVATDNATGDTKHYLFSPNGGVPATGVLRVSAVTPLTPGALPPQSTKRRAVRHP